MLGPVRLQTNVEKELTFICDLCNNGVKYTRRPNMERHKASIHFGTGKICCNQCGSNYAGKQSLDLHIKVMHEGKFIKCNICDYQTKRDGQLVFHKRINMIKASFNVTNAISRQIAKYLLQHISPTYMKISNATATFVITQLLQK